MGVPSDKRRSARRPGKRERARVKNYWSNHRSGIWSSAWGAGTATAYLGRKKMAAAMRSSIGGPSSRKSGQSL